jgi:hypothetical protein
MIDALSLLLINGSIGLAFGLSFSLARDVLPTLGAKRHLALVAVAAWAVVIFGLSLFGHPTDLIARRVANSFTTLWVAYLLCRYTTRPTPAPPPAPPPAPHPVPPSSPRYRRHRSDRRVPSDDRLTS